MRLFHRINLLLSSIPVLLCLACSPLSGYKYLKTGRISEQELRPVIDKDKAQLFKAKIDLYNQHFSGLILLKQLNQEVSHLTFVTEIGMKMFDFEVKDSVFRLVYVFEPLNKPRIIQLLQEDMKLLLMQHLSDKEASIYERKDQKIFKVKEDFRYYYKLKPGSALIDQIIKKGSLFRKVNVRYSYNDSLQIRTIRLKHKGLVRLKIELTQLTKAAP
jgi:hypothetical protein